MIEKPTFLERLTEKYPGRFTVERKIGAPPKDRAFFAAENKHFGAIEIAGDFDEWRDEADYYVEDENGVYDDADTCGFEFRSYSTGKCGVLSPTDLFALLDEIFADRIICYRSLLKKTRGLYRIEEFKKALDEGRVRRKKAYTFWTGEYPIEHVSNAG